MNAAAPTAVASPPPVLAERAWQARAAAHEARTAPWVEPHLARGKAGAKHPVYDFLFHYYPYRAAHLQRWHPGPDVVLAGAAARAFLRWPEYRETAGGVAVDPAGLPEKRREFLRWLRDFFRLTAERPPQFGCFGLHEWAMVYRLAPGEVRHTALPLRMEPERLAQFVEAQPVCCTHFDAFRFFTPPARPLNRLQPTRETVPQLEQRGCLHANMDLYKWAYKLAPFTPAELVADCFELARDVREADMRASPYDVSSLGFAAIAIETPEGREEYARLQRGFAERGQPLRARLLALTERLLAAGESPATGATFPRLSDHG